MRKFLSTIFTFLIPFFFITLILFYIDPYNVIRPEKNENLLQLKKQISYKKNYPLYKLQEYSYKPTEVIVLGDSRANHLNAHSFENISHEKVTNLAYGAGTIQEIVETFWIISKKNKLKKVYIGLNFNLYNAFNIRNSVKTANNLRKSIPSYLYSRYSIESSILILKSLILNEEVNIEKPPYSKEEFWEYQLNVSVPKYYKNYKYPSTYYNELLKISEYCKMNRIELIFFIPPTHIDLQKKINEYNLETEYEKFKKDLMSFNTPVFDFNIENTMTNDKKYFGDPFHFIDEYEEIIINVISHNIKSQEKFKDFYDSLGR